MREMSTFRVICVCICPKKTNNALYNHLYLYWARDSIAYRRNTNSINNNSMKKHYLMSLLLASLALVSCSQGKADFKIGADISEVPANEARGGKYYDADGKEADICDIMKANGFDVIRLRLFVNPEAEKGYSRDGFCGTESTIQFAKRIIASGMDFALDFHYSDTWADPDKQYKPSAWEGLTGKALEDKLYEYTKEVLVKMKEEGVAPVIVQVGNEINHGLVWPEGYINDNATEENWAAAMGLYAAGARAVREVLPKAKLQVHLALGGENGLCHQYLDYMKKYGAEFDIIGLSYYERWHETYDDLKANLDDLAKTYKVPVCVCEYGANEDNIKIINDIVRSVPKGMGYGTMAWAPSRTLFGEPDPNATEEVFDTPNGQRRFRRTGGMSKNIFEIYRKLDESYTQGVKPEVAEPYVRKVNLDDKIIGADISFVPQEEARGKKYSDKGVEKDVLEIMSDNGFNYIRLRLFVDPTAENGYSKDGFCGLEQTLAMAKRIKAAGMKFLLDFHYSDTWADPEKQFKPASWSRDSGSGLEGRIYSYSKETIERFISEGVRPDMVQIGNEINNGMVWPQGKIEDSYMSFAVMLRCASAGVRAADPTIQIMVHIACGGDNEKSVEFFDKIISRDVKFDIIGQSYYPKWHGELDGLKANLTDLATRYHKPIVVVEYQQYRKEVNEIVASLPENLGLGTFIWEATSPAWGDLFGRDGATNENMALYPEIVKLYEKK